MKFKIFTVVAAVALVAGIVYAVQARTPDSGYRPYHGPSASAGTPSARAAPTRRIALNTTPADYPRLRELGFDLVDAQPDDASLAQVPAGMRAMLWVGNFTCDGFALPFDAFAAAVRRYGHDPRVYGWYLSDEPNPGECPGVLGEIRRRADLVKAQAPGQIAFVSLTDWPMRDATPAKLHVDVVGLDPYPCKGGTSPRADCDLGTIDRMVRLADDAGIPRGSVAPVLQAFGQDCSRGDKQYWMPTADQFKGILARWDRLVPDPPLEIAYSWGHQAKYACPTLSDAAALQSILKERNRTR
ncbi:hypothetical protein [Actinomadura rupiterrae]|uniref:hypothetical protein n=1 Tax=Actinomadura rupiterrae TaxID=559627 RepID=UPI0020A2D0FA|nr:hypothetical protein [Actinomadura rupiterrae]MCP2335065.1 hypothetical protein [Actinomadura rupiterrae]